MSGHNRPGRRRVFFVQRLTQPPEKQMRPYAASLHHTCKTPLFGSLAAFILYPRPRFHPAAIQPRSTDAERSSKTASGWLTSRCFQTRWQGGVPSLRGWTGEFQFVFVSRTAAWVARLLEHEAWLRDDMATRELSKEHCKLDSRKFGDAGTLSMCDHPHAET